MKREIKFAALLAVVEVDDHGGDIVNLKGGRVAEDQHLENRRPDQDEARALVAHDLDEFLDQHLLQASEHRFSFYSSLLWKLRVATSASTTAKPARGSKSADSIAAGVPLRKIFLSSVT